MTHSDTLDQLAAALAAAQASLSPAIKDSTNPHFRSGYASLQSVWDAAKEVLAPNGLSLAQGFENGANGETVTVTCLLLHKSGQWLKSSLTLKPSKPDPQGIGSAITYGRRYSLAAMLGIVADEDDDANGACHPPVKKVEAKKEEPKPAFKKMQADTEKQVRFYASTAKGAALIDKVLAKHGLLAVDDFDEDMAVKTVTWIESELKKQEAK